MFLELTAGATQFSGSTRDFQQLADDAPIVVVATIRDRRYEMFDRERGIPVTRYTVDVQESLKGRISRSVAEFTLPGGEAEDGQFYEFDGAPTPVIGERYLLFLVPIDDVHVRAVDWSTAIIALQDGEDPVVDGRGRVITTSDHGGLRVEHEVATVEDDVCVDGPLVEPEPDETALSEWWTMTTEQALQYARRATARSSSGATIGGVQ